MLNIILSLRDFIGYLDIAVILLLILSLIIGFLVGFARIVIKIANWVCGILISLIFCSRFAKVLGLLFRKPIYNHFYNKVSSSETIQNITSETTAQEGLQSALHDLGLPSWLAKFISKSFSGEAIGDVADTICDTIAKGITNAILMIMSFLILWIGISIIILLIKLHIEDLRENRGFRIVDGIFGSILGIIIMFMTLEIIFYIFTLADASDSFMNFLNIDMRLESGKGFGLARWFYKRNFIKAFLDLFF